MERRRDLRWRLQTLGVGQRDGTFRKVGFAEHPRCLMAVAVRARVLVDVVWRLVRGRRRLRLLLNALGHEDGLARLSAASRHFD